MGTPAVGARRREHAAEHHADRGGDAGGNVGVFVHQLIRVRRLAAGGGGQVAGSAATVVERMPQTFAEREEFFVGGVAGIGKGGLGLAQETLEVVNRVGGRQFDGIRGGHG